MRKIFINIGLALNGNKLPLIEQVFGKRCFPFFHVWGYEGPCWYCIRCGKVPYNYSPDDISFAWKHPFWAKRFGLKPNLEESINDSYLKKIKEIRGLQNE